MCNSSVVHSKIFFLCITSLKKYYNVTLLKELQKGVINLNWSMLTRFALSCWLNLLCMGQQCLSGYLSNLTVWVVGNSYFSMLNVINALKCLHLIKQLLLVYLWYFMFSISYIPNCLSLFCIVIDNYFFHCFVLVFITTISNSI